MTYVKRIMFCLLLFTGLWLSSEAYGIYVAQLGDSEMFQLDGADEKESSDILKTIDGLAQSCHVNYALVRLYYDSNGVNCLDFYCKDAVKKYLQKKSWYREGTIKSLLFETSKVAYYSLEQIDRELLIKGEYRCIATYGEGESDEFLYRWQELTGAKIQAPIIRKKYVQCAVLVMWILLISILFSIILLNRMLERKEFFVALSLGDGLEKSILRSVLGDTITLLVAFAVSCIVVRSTVGQLCFFYEACFALIAIVLLDVGLYASMMYNSFRYAVSNALMSEDTVLFGFFLLVCFTVLLCVLTGFFDHYRKEYVELKKQESLYADLSGYYYVSFSPFGSEVLHSGESDVDVFENAHRADRRFYEEFQSKYDIVVYSNILSTAACDFVYVNANGRRLLDNVLPVQIPECDTPICFYPAEFRTEVLRSFHPELFLYGKSYNTLTWIPYFGEICTGALSSESEFRVVKNPIFVYESRNSFEPNGWKEREGVPYGLKFCARCSEEEILHFASEEKCKAYYTKVSESFYREYRRIRNLYYGLLVGILIFFCLLAALYSIIMSLETRVNKLEYAIKKTMGMSLYDRFYKVFLLNGVAFILGVIASLMLLSVLDMKVSSGIVILWGGMFILGAVGIAIVGFRAEKECVQKALKNG